VMGYKTDNIRISIQQLKIYTLSKLYHVIAGGWDTAVSNVIEKYNRTAGWSAGGATLTNARRYVRGFTLLNKAYITGGLTASATVKDNDEFVLATSTKTAKKAMTTARHYHGCFVINDKGIVVSGLGADNKQTNTVEEYDSTDNAWTSLGDVNHGYQMGFFAIPENNVMKGVICGGRTDASIKISRKYTRATDTWNIIASMLENSVRMGSCRINNKGYVNVRSIADVRNYIREYDIDKNIWTAKINDTPANFDVGMSTYLNEGITSGGGTYGKHVTRYNPVTGAFQKTTDRSTWIESHAAVALHT